MFTDRRDAFDVQFTEADFKPVRIEQPVRVSVIEDARKNPNLVSAAMSFTGKEARPVARFPAKGSLTFCGQR